MVDCVPRCAFGAFRLELVSVEPLLPILWEEPLAADAHCPGPVRGPVKLCPDMFVAAAPKKGKAISQIHHRKRGKKIINGHRS